MNLIELKSKADTAYASMLDLSSSISLSDGFISFDEKMKLMDAYIVAYDIKKRIDGFVKESERMADLGYKLGAGL
jgi:hypothetical protein